MTLINLLRLIKWPKKLLIIIIIFSIVSAGISLTLPILTRDLIDALTNQSITKNEILIFIGLFIVNALVSGFTYYLIKVLGSKIMYNLRSTIFAHILKLKTAFYDQTESGIVISRMTDDIENINSFVTEKVTNLLSQIIIVIGAVSMLFVLDWKITLLIFIAIPVVLLVILPIGNMTYKVALEKQDSLANFTSLMNRVLSEIRLVKVYNAEKKEFNLANKSLKNMYRLNLKEAKIQSIVSPIVTSVVLGVLFSVLGYGVYRISNGTLTAGTFVAVVFYLVQAITPMASLSAFYTEFKKTEGSTKKLYDLYLEESEQIDQFDNKGTSKSLVNNLNENITFSNVSFSYNGKEQVLKNINFSIPAHKVTAIVGPSGSGKSTIFYLLERLYQLSEGEILLNNININDYPLDEWRKQIGYVMQESGLMAGTLEENLVYGIDENYEIKDLEYAASISNSSQFISKFESKFQTQVGERGVKLSGGQKQRISIGRALLRDPNILLLDEATSSLDSESEFYVQEAISKLIKNRTTLIIAHRLSTIKNADQIIFLDNGVITGIGKHDELVKSHEKYRYFVQTQSFD